MRYLELTFLDPARNLACDEALLDACESGSAEAFLRIWEPVTHFVVAGYSNKSAAEVDLSACASAGIPVLRRFTGGGTVLQGPGCLNYTVVFEHAALRTVSDAFAFVLRRHQSCLARLLGLLPTIEGSSDLAVGGRKISGNAQHRKRRFTLVHGTFLLNLDFSLMEALLPPPSREPEYRRRRSHSEFLMNLEIPAADLKRALRQSWEAEANGPSIPEDTIERLVAGRYARADWNFKF
ncbi:MAG TPA: lipoate--protein ligase family protein [Candidatus Eisenbacteria bacterium]|nr:lipoate--protein ligase family protein [Candidatus Eisenbacteria bacterium]